MERKPSQKHIQQPAPRIDMCQHCQAFVGRNYPQCPHCREVVEQPIRAAWQALLRTENITAGTPQERALAATVLTNSDQYWWSEVEAALRLTPCPACGGPLGYGSPGCVECISSSDMVWGGDLDVDESGTLRRNEHALRVMLRGLGQSRRHSKASIEGWRLCLPFILHGSQPDTTRDDVRFAQALNAWIKAGRGHELMHCRSFDEMDAIIQRGRK